MSSANDKRIIDEVKEKMRVLHYSTILKNHIVIYQMLQISIRSGKGGKDRFSTFPASISPVLNNHLSKVKTLHDKDLLNGWVC